MNKFSSIFLKYTRLHISIASCNFLSSFYVNQFIMYETQEEIG